MSDRYERSRRDFERVTAEHEVRIVRDDGLYRHLRCNAPGTWVYGFDIVTWPGRLYIGGDTEDYVFSRTDDMFEFFEGTPAGRINPGYWSEKLQGPSHGEIAREFSEDKFRRKVREWLTEVSEGLAPDEAHALKVEVDEQILDMYEFSDETHARLLLRDFNYKGYVLGEEWDLTDYTSQFLWACWAIVWAIGKYRALTREVAHV